MDVYSMDAYYLEIEYKLELKFNKLKFKKCIYYITK